MPSFLAKATPGSGYASRCSQQQQQQQQQVKEIREHTLLTWQKVHHGAYSTSRVSLSRFPPASSCTCALVSALTLPSIQRSRSALRSSTVPSAFFTLPLCSPHSFSARGEGGGGRSGACLVEVARGHNGHIPLALRNQG